MSKRKFFKPTIQGRNLGVDLKVGEEKDVHVDIPPTGYRAENEKIEKALEKHELYGHSFGFIEVAEKDLKNQKPQQFTGESSIENIRPAAAKSSKVEIIEEEEETEEPDSEEDEEEEVEPESETETEEESTASDKVTDTDGDGEITVDDVTTWQQAKDHLINVLGVDGRTINSKAKVKATAEEQNVNFPNVSWD